MLWENTVEGSTEVQVKNNCSLSLIHLVGHPVIEGGEVGHHAGPAFPNLILAGPDPCLPCTCCVMAQRMSCSMTFPGTELSLYRSVVPWILLPTLLAHGHHICSPPANWDLPSEPPQDWGMVESGSVSTSPAPLVPSSEFHPSP